MRWLMDRIAEAGGQLEQRGLAGLDDLAGEGFDGVVVACGLGAVGLLGDEECYPIRGQVGGNGVGRAPPCACVGGYVGKPPLVGGGPAGGGGF
jgi:hypothetical protein